MKQIFPAIFRTIWKRKETQIYLSFTLFPFIYLVTSFIEGSNFMQIHASEGSVSLVAFTNMMMSSVDSFILPSLTLYFLAISVFRKEVDEHTMFLYRDLGRKQIFWSKYLGLLATIVIFYGLFFATSAFVHYVRVIHLPFGSPSVFDTSLAESLSNVFCIVAYLLKDILSVSLATALCLYLKNITTMVTGFLVTITMMILVVVGGPIAMLFPTSYMPLASEGLTGVGLAYLGAIGVTLVYALVFTKIAAKKFKNLEF
ncbi:hypothetical protein ACTGJ2_00350 [Streptococcus suis]|uniref:Sugar ABC transporter permease n=1 Tax=Streptococcus suis TaxID=1307 RepID=A0A0Z8XMG2_STRSU|nr:membrane protein [Streptococcus suis]MCK4075237.1 hypothetical protein [Streptococcus suis]MCL4923321.1 hypothetical protein [Streptococcus suis]MDD7565785.1 hypothetical protein [Streptococcus suis]MDY5054520.1 hypothetical protein [Streptococcus suis]NQH52883.1 hypothetical protein [Streptococcus suis]